MSRLISAVVASRYRHRVEVGLLYGYGDSIMAGVAVSNHSWFDRLADYGVNETNHSQSGHSLKGDTDPNDAAAMDAYIAANMVPVAPNTLWDAMGINDSGDNSNAWSGSTDATAFGAGKGLFWDRIKAALPEIHIFASVMPIGYITGNQYLVNGAEGLHNSQQAVRDAQATRQDFVTLVDWADLLVESDLADQVHPNAGGNDKMLASALLVLGV